MQFIDLERQRVRLGDQLSSRLNRVLERADFILGEDVVQLEEALAAYTGRRHVISCANGTDALLMPLMALGIGRGDAVFVPSFTFFASAEVVALVGATPVFVDNDATFTMSAPSLERAVATVKAQGTLRPRAVIAVDLFGQLADYEAIGAIAKAHDLVVIEDGAQSFGASYGGRMSGAFGSVSTTSFFPAKPLGCYGDGGAIMTDDDELASCCRSLRVHGKGRDRYDNVRIGLNSRLDTMQAAILLAKLTLFDEEMAARDRIARRYTERLDGYVDTPALRAGGRSAWAQYTMRLADRATRDRVQASLKARGIPSMIYYPIPLHRQRAFHDRHLVCERLVHAERDADTVLSLPMHPYLTDEEIDTVASGVIEALGAGCD